MKVVTAGEMRAIEKKADAYGLSSPVLMHLAGLAMAEEIERAIGGVAGRRIVILVGPGNNGGDGLVAACHLHDRGARVSLYLVSRPIDGDLNFALCRLRQIEYVDDTSDPGQAQLTTLLLSADVVIDALLGIGLGRPITGTIKKVLDTVAAVAADGGWGPGFGDPHPGPLPYFVALDIPTGLNSDTGEAEAVCFAADLTVALGYPKVGMFNFPGAAKVGKLVTRGIGLPEQLAADIKTELLDAGYVRSLLPPRPANANKGTFGRVLVVGGSVNYIGAPCLAALAALRAGAGLVTLATCASLQSISAAGLTEATRLPLPEVPGGGALGMEAAAVVGRSLGDYNTLLIGCGLGRHPDTAECVRTILRSCPPGLKVIVDADGLNALSEKDNWWGEMPGPLVLTPHPGEMARLTGESVGQVNARRLDIARQFSARCGKVVVLKGANTVIASPAGYVNINMAANPVMATAGIGDVLSGVIAGLLAQGLADWDAASAGVYVHGEAAALSSEMGEAGLLASELAHTVPRVLKSLRQTHFVP